ncbi:MAG: SusC/RagA family TonB-linked outer membrane protein [Fermentimonas sp.]|jgi:TonB-linked SusC/RagA family outer membrane protein
MNVKSILIFCLAFITSFSVFAQQQITVSGVVMEGMTGDPAIGVSILVKGTTNGTVTDIDGNYTLSNVPSDATLVFSYIGMLSVEEEVNGRTKIDVVMSEDVQALEELVVIGYGTSKSKDLTAPIAVVKSEDIVKHATTNPMGSLQGKVAGVLITNGGQPGSGPDVKIRGVGSFSDTQPLYVVDGMFYDNINFLNNSDIQDISILKDASAASIYGVRAANGVVIVTTKRGALNSKPTITYDGYYGIQRATNVLEMANSEQYATMQLEKGSETDKAILMNSINRYGGDKTNIIPGASTSWYDELLRTAHMQNHSLDITGGTDKVTYSLGVNYLSQEGIMDAVNDYERYNIRVKSDYSMYDWMKVGANFVYSSSTKRDPNNSAWSAAFVTPPIIPAYDEDNTNAFPEKLASPAQVGYSTYFGNPLARAHYHDAKSKVNQFLPSFYTEIYILPQNRLTLRSAFSQDISFINGRTYTPEYYVGGDQQVPKSILNKYNDFYKNWIIDNTLTYTDSFGAHNLTAMLGHSSRSETFRNLWGEATGVPGDYEEYLYLSQGNADGRKTGDGGHTYRGLSYFGRVMYNYGGKYYLSATMRADGSSKYQEKWGYFPSVGASWNISEEDFMKDQNVIDFMKLRASWGKLGNDKVQASDGFASVTQNMGTSGVFGNGIIPGYTNLIYFSWLRWEVVNETNVGFEAMMLRNRLRLEADYYHRITENAVISAPLPMGAGNLLGNYGRILNSGVELSLNWQDQISDDFSYYVGGNLTTIHNEVLNLNGIPYIYGGSAEFRTISKVGGQLNAFYGHRVLGVYQNQAEIDSDPIAVANGLVPGDFKYDDINGDNIINDEDRVVLGSYLPKFNYGFNLGFEYKNFEFSTVMQGVYGNDIANKKRGYRRWQGDINYDVDMVKNRWTGEGSTNKYPSALGTVNPWNISKFNSFAIEDGSYFRIQNIQAAYTFDKKENFPAVRVSLTAERPYTYFTSNGFTPEVGGIGFDDQVYPLAATYTIGLRITY